MVNKDSVTKVYRENLKKQLDNEIEQYIDLQGFLNVSSWYDKHLALRKKEDMVYEEDKQDIDQEIREVKELLYSINLSENGLLHIDAYVDTILFLWPEN
mmetsp:Transcript_14842/g.13046  ORF Transcript_14842/g.13046 Transcript_14842/m.13046 type:complete len:99 (-) Transcript_14842:29-325(-)